MVCQWQGERDKGEGVVMSSQTKKRRVWGVETTELTAAYGTVEDSGGGSIGGSTKAAGTHHP